VKNAWLETLTGHHTGRQSRVQDADRQNADQLDRRRSEHEGRSTARPKGKRAHWQAMPRRLRHGNPLIAAEAIFYADLLHQILDRFEELAEVPG
jgi:hypothetical protein